MSPLIIKLSIDILPIYTLCSHVWFSWIIYKDCSLTYREVLQCYGRGEDTSPLLPGTSMSFSPAPCGVPSPAHRLRKPPAINAAAEWGLKTAFPFGFLNWLQRSHGLFITNLNPGMGPGFHLKPQTNNFISSIYACLPFSSPWLTLLYYFFFLSLFM